MQLCPPTTQSLAAEHLHCGNPIDLPHPSAISAQTPAKSICNRCTCNRCTGHQIIMFAKLTNGKYGQGRKDSQTKSWWWVVWIRCIGRFGVLVIRSGHTQMWGACIQDASASAIGAHLKPQKWWNFDAMTEPQGATGDPKGAKTHFTVDANGSDPYLPVTQVLAAK